MNINNSELEFLIKLVDELYMDDGHRDSASRLIEITEKLAHQRAVRNEHTRVAIAEKRKTDKNYARSKKV